MPSYFKTKNEQLHAEAFASLLILEDRWNNGDCTLKLAVAVLKARERVYRRWRMAYGR